MRNSIRWFTLGLLLVGAATALGDSGGPLESLTGAPGEGLCTDCHASNPLNTSGSIDLTSAPAYYKGGSTYTMTVHLVSGQTAGASGRKWGFQVTAINNAGAGIGTFATVAGQGTQIVAGQGSLATRRYVEQNDQGTRTGLASPTDWQIKWTAPPAGSGPVTFYLAGNAANGDGSEGGDWIYKGSYAMGDSATAAVPSTWGAVKASYR